MSEITPLDDPSPRFRLPHSATVRIVYGGTWNFRVMFRIQAARRVGYDPTATARNTYFARQGSERLERVILIRVFGNEDRDILPLLNQQVVNRLEEACLQWAQSMTTSEGNSGSSQPATTSSPRS